MEDPTVHRLLPSLLLLGLVAFVVPSEASAQQGAPKLRIGAGMVLDFAGEADYDNPWRDDDLNATIGLRAHLDYDLGRYVSLGGFVRLSWWEGDYFYEERSMLFDLGPRITGHYDWRDFRFYVAGMPGLVISKLNNDYDERYRYDRRFDNRYYPYGWGYENPAVGFTMSIAPGMEYWFNNDFAVYVEIFGWVGHYFSHDFENAPGDNDFSLNQVAFNFGIVFAP